MEGIIDFLKNLFVLNYLPDPGSNAGYGLLFVFGLLTSIHCVGMCGGIVMTQCIPTPAAPSGEAAGKPRAWLAPSLLYNAGRLVSYAAVGVIVGGAGHAVSFHGIWKGTVPIIGGLFMIIMAINLLGIFPALRKFNIRPPSFFAKKVMRSTGRSPAYAGLLTGLMPCGPLQIMQLYALGAGSALGGAASMLAFAAGTVPVLFAFGALNTAINKKHSLAVLKASAAVVLVLGILMIGRGLALSGVNVPVFYAAGEGNVAAVDGKVQTVTTEIQSGSYPPIVVQKGIPVRWTIKVKKENLNNCNDTIEIPAFKLEKTLTEGDNRIEFTPENEGELIYTCWMGMIKSKITVVEDIKRPIDQKALK